MSIDEPVARVLARSQIARVAWQTVERLDGDARRSRMAAALARAYAAVRALSPAGRVRLAGTVVLTATATNVLLLQSAAMTAAIPAVSSLVSVLSAAAGVALIVLAGAIARAWSGSRVRSIIAGTRAPQSKIGDRA